MHPHIQLPEAGQCPICFMDLIPLVNQPRFDLESRTLELSSTAVALAEIQTVPVERRTVTGEVRLYGKVQYDETRFRTITAWVPGRLDTLFVDFTGTVVQKGQKMASIYSPELYAAQTELLGALQAERETAESSYAIIRETAESTVRSAHNRLKLWGLTEGQIAAIAERGIPADHLTLVAPRGGVVVEKYAQEGLYVKTGSPIYAIADLSHVWVILDAYESDLPWLGENQDVMFTLEALPGKRFLGTIVFIDPILTEDTRTVRVRLETDNRQGLLKPGMFVRATVAIEFSEKRSINREVGEDQLPLVIPASAPLLTGKRAIVYVRLPDRQQPTFEGREVVLGPRAGDHYLVVSGLTEGELVVVKGNFKIDSALQIQARPSMMSPDRPSVGAELDGDVQGISVKPLTVSRELYTRLGEILNGYLDIQAALAGDDDRSAEAAADSALKTIGSWDEEIFSPDTREFWQRDVERFQRTITFMRDAPDIANRREAFLPLSEHLWQILRKYDYHRTVPVRLFHCPMAKGGLGADWIQLEKTTANPYYGASMLRCGSQTDSIPAADHESGGQ